MKKISKLVLVAFFALFTVGVRANYIAPPPSPIGESVLVDSRDQYEYLRSTGWTIKYDVEVNTNKSANQSRLTVDTYYIYELDNRAYNTTLRAPANYRVAYDVNKTAEFITFHAGLASDLKTFAFATDIMLTALGGAGVGNLIQTACGQVAGCNESLIALGAIGAVLAGGPAGMAIASLAMISYILDDQAERQLKLALDPPDPNFLQIFAYNPSAFSFDWGLGEEGNSYFNELLYSFERVNQNLNGRLASLERFQGALIAGDAEASFAQLQNYQFLNSDYSAFSSKAGNLLMGLPNAFNKAGVSDVSAGNVSSFELYRSAGALIGGTERPTSQVPEPSTFLLAIFGFAGVLLSRRKIRYLQA